MRARYYELSSGRFISEDPVRQALNWFAFCFNCPVTFCDKDGREGDLTETLVSSSESGQLGNYIFDRPAINALIGITNRLQILVGWMTKFGGAAVSITKFIDGLEQFTQGQGCSSILFRFTATTPGGSEIIDKLLDELGDKGAHEDGPVNQILWTIVATDSD